MILATGALLPATAFAQAETEPNDTKAQANVFALPAVNTPAVITGNSTSAAGVGLDYFRVTTAAQATAGFYRHRLIVSSSIVGHTATIRGLNQTNGVIGTTDTTIQTSAATTTPPRFIQWYTNETAGTLFVRITGAATTTADYALNYEVQAVTEIIVPQTINEGARTITSVGQTTADTEIWVHDANRVPLAGFGNDDTIGPPTSTQSTLTRTYVPGTHHLAISTFNMCNNLASPADDNFDDGAVMDFPNVIVNNVTTLNQDVDHLIDGIPVTALKQGAFDIVFVQFVVTVPVELTGFSIE